VATTIGQRGPGTGTSTRRSSSTPVSAAASRPSWAKPTTAHHAPACEGPHNNVNSNEADPVTATVVPRRSPASGRTAASAETTGSNRSPLSPTRRAGLRAISCRAASAAGPAMPANPASP
jgi:hypothetical protein